MKRTLFLLSALLISSIVFAQAPDAFKYQAVVRDNAGILILEQNVGIQIEILKGAADGTAVYTETHSATTNGYGLVNLEIGNGTTTDDLATVNWGDDDYFIQVSLDATGGTSYDLMGTSQLLSVPYSLHSSVADSVVKESQTLTIDGNTLSISDGNSVDLPSGGTGTNQGSFIVTFTGDISDSEAAQKIIDEIGTNTKYIYVLNTTQLTTLDISGVRDLVELNVQFNLLLSTLTISNLVSCLECYSRNNTSLTSLNLNALSHVNLLSIGNCENLSVVGLSNLEWGGEEIGISETLISSINIPKLEMVDKLSISGSSITSINVSSLKTCERISIGSTSLTTIDLSNLSSYSGIFIVDNSFLTSIDISGLSSFDGFDAVRNSLSSEAVNGLLAHFVAITPSITGKHIRLHDQTPLAPPTGQGITDKATLIANGNTVETD